MQIVLTAFIIVSSIFAVASLATGIQALINPISFSQTFGIPIAVNTNKPKPAASTTQPESAINTSTSYVSLMGVRQLATGIILLIFAYQEKWSEMATTLVVLGSVVATTDGALLLREGKRSEASFHAIPGALIALLSGAMLLTAH